MRRSSVAFKWLWIAILAAAWGAQNARADEPLDLAYISSDAIAAVVVQPRRLFADPKLEMLPTEVFIAMAQENLGIDLSEVNVAIGILGLSGIANGEPGLGLILHFQKPYDPHAVRERLGPDVQEVSHNDRKYWKVGVGPGSALCVATPKERVLLLGNEPQIKKMLTAENVDSGLTKLLKQADLSKSAVAVLDFATVRPLVMLGLQNAPPLPPEIAQFLDAAKLVKSVQVTLSLDPLAVDLRVGANDAAAAAQLKLLAEKAKQMVRELVEQQVGQMAAADDSKTARATNQYMRRVTNMMLDAIQIKVEDDKVNVFASSEKIGSNVATVGVLVGLMLPAVQSAREAARRAQSANNLRQIGLAMHTYHDSRRAFPGRAIVDKDGKPLLSWRVAILPYIEQDNLYRAFHLDEPWDSEHNLKLIDKMPAIYSNPNVADPQRTVYQVVDGKGTMFGSEKPPRMAQIIDGTSNTIMAVETDADRAVPWTKPDDLHYDAERPLAGLGKLRPSGFQVLFADGSVRVIAPTIDADVLRALMTMAGREVVNLPSP